MALRVAASVAASLALSAERTSGAQQAPAVEVTGSSVEGMSSVWHQPSTHVDIDSSRYPCHCLDIDQRRYGGGAMTETDTQAAVREEVRARYATAAQAVTGGGAASCCGPAAEAIQGAERFRAGPFYVPAPPGPPPPAPPSPPR